jgi:hypothetical protein
MKVYLKYNKENTDSIKYLLKWIKIFEKYETKIICDLENIEPISRITDIEILRTNYSLKDPIAHLCKHRRWENVAASNLTCYKDAGLSSFWLIDADDTEFLTDNIELLRKKIKNIEKIFEEECLDGISLDFYREIKKDHWSFGMALLRQKTDLYQLLTSLTAESIQQHKGLILNIDSMFDALRRYNKLNLKSFVFDGEKFFHDLYQVALINNTYYWKDRKIWDNISLKPDVISV